MYTWLFSSLDAFLYYKPDVFQIWQAITSLNTYLYMQISREGMGCSHIVVRHSDIWVKCYLLAIKIGQLILKGESSNIFMFWSVLEYIAVLLQCIISVNITLTSTLIDPALDMAYLSRPWALWQPISTLRHQVSYRGNLLPLYCDRRQRSTVPGQGILLP